MWDVNGIFQIQLHCRQFPFSFVTGIASQYSRAKTMPRCPHPFCSCSICALWLALANSKMIAWPRIVLYTLTFMPTRVMKWHFLSARPKIKARLTLFYLIHSFAHQHFHMLSSTNKLTIPWGPCLLSFWRDPTSEGRERVPKHMRHCNNRWEVCSIDRKKGEKRGRVWRRH